MTAVETMSSGPSNPPGGGAPLPANLDDPANVRRWLQKHHPKQLALLDNFEISLRLGRFGADASGKSAAPQGGGGPRGDVGPAPSRYQYGRERRLLTTRTVDLLRAIVGPARWKTPAQLLTLLRGVGNELHAAGGYREPAIGNVVRRVMYAVRDEADRTPPDMEKIDELTEQVSTRLRVTSPAPSAPTGAGSGTLSLASMLWAHPQHVTHRHSRQPSGDLGDRVRSDSFGSESGAGAACDPRGGGGGGPAAAWTCYPPHYHIRRDDLRQGVMEAIQEMMSELEDLHKNINEQAVQHIHAGEVILTYALSKTVELFLKAAAAKKRKFKVIVCEGSPHFGGHVMAKSLAEAGIDTTVIHDAATFAIMARVNKVLLPAHAVLANGGLIAPSGSNMVALAAKHNSVPVVTVAGMFKLCPMYPHEGQDTLNDLISPSSVADYGLVGDPALSEVEFVNPVHDYVPPRLIDLYVTNIGGFQPSYIYRLLAEYYHSDDWDAFE